VDTAALDAFFAEAEDVLTDWHGSADAVHGSSYYEQPVGGGGARLDWQSLIAEWVARGCPDVMRASEVPPIPEWNRGRTLAELSQPRGPRAPAA
jgi:hypothetical protein